MGPRKISFSEAQRRYDNLTPEDVVRVHQRCRVREEEDYEDESYYKSAAFAKVMDAYERRIYGD